MGDRVAGLWAAVAVLTVACAEGTSIAPQPDATPLPLDAAMSPDAAPPSVMDAALSIMDLAPPAEDLPPRWPEESILEIVSGDGDTLRLSWPAASDDSMVARYRLLRDALLIRETVETTAVVARPSPATRVRFQVVAIDDGNQRTLGPTATYGAPDEEAPQWPADAALVVSSLNGRNATLAWPAALDSDGIQHYLLSVGDAPPRVVAGTHFRLDALSPRTTLRCTVRAVDDAGNTSTPLETTLTTPGGIPPTWPEGSIVAPLEVSATALRVRWTPAHDDEAVVQYRLFIGLLPVAQTAGDTVVATIDGLEPHTRYEVSVAAEDADGHIVHGPRAVLRTLDSWAPQFAPDARLRASSVADTHVRLGWDPAFDDDRVALYRLHREGGPTTEVVGTSTVVDGLSPWTDYRFSLSAVDASGNVSLEGPSLMVRTLDMGPPTWPSDSLLVEDVVTGRVRVSWEHATDDAAVVEYRLLVDNEVRHVLAGDVREVTLDALAPWTWYVVSVVAFDASGNASSAQSRRFRTRDDLPPSWGRRDALEMRDLSPTGGTLSWPAATDNVRVTTYLVTQDGTLIAAVPGDITTFAVTGLDPWVDYTFTVHALDGAGLRADPLALSVRTPDRVAPRWAMNPALAARALHPHGGILTWSVATDDVAHTYRVSQDGALIAEVPGDQHQLAVDGLTPWTEYRFSVDAVDAAGNRAPSTLSAVVRTLDEVPPRWGPEATLTVSNRAPDALTLRWPPADDDVGVRYVLTRDGGLQTSFGEHIAEARIEGLTPWTEYRFELMAVDPAGNTSADPLSVTVRTPDIQSPTWPLEARLRSTEVTPDAVRLEWPPAVDDVGVVYTVRRDENVIARLPRGTESIRVEGLAPWVDYTFFVEAEDPAGNVSDAPLSLTVRTPDPGPPTWPIDARLDAEDIEPTRMVLRWPPARDEVGVQYLVYRDARLLAVVDEGTEQLDVQGLLPFTDYRFRVVATDPAGQRAAQDLQLEVRTPDVSPPEWPADARIQVRTRAPDRLVVTWSAAIDPGGLSYLIHFEGEFVATVDADTTEFVFEALSPWTEYTVEVHAVDRAGNAAERPLVAVERTHDAVAPSWPDDSRLVDLHAGPEEVTLQWPPAADDVGIAGYRVALDGRAIETVDDQTVEYPVVGIRAGRYRFTVEAMDAAGNASEPLQLDETLGIPDCVDPLIATASATSSPALGIVHLDIDGGTGTYDVQLLEGPSGGQVGARPFAYIAGETTGVTDILRVTDAHCRDVIDLEIEVLAPMRVRPLGVTLPLGACTAFDVEGGSGRYTYEVVSATPLGHIDDAGLYTAGNATGLDLVHVTDQVTGELVEARVNLTAAGQFSFASPRLAVPLGSHLEPSFDIGTGQHRLQVAGDAVVVDENGRRLVARSVGTAVVTATDTTVGCLGPDADRPAQATTEVQVIAALEVPMDAHGGNHDQRLFGPHDFNGDGFGDLIVADAETSVGGLNSGAFEIFLGGPDGLQPRPHQVFSGQETGGKYGYTFALGDFDADGIDDLAVGAPGELLSGVGEGAVYLYRGEEDGTFAPTPMRVLSGLSGTNNDFGNALATCDFDGDGFDDLALGSPEAPSTDPALWARGFVALYYGGPDGLSPIPRQRIWGLAPRDGTWQGFSHSAFGERIAAGDYDGDGVCDLAALMFGYGDFSQDVNNVDVDPLYLGGTVMLLRGIEGFGLHPTPLRHFTQPMDDPGYEAQGFRAFGTHLALQDLDDDGRAELITSQAIFRGEALPAVPEDAPVLIEDAVWRGFAEMPLPFTLADIDDDGQTDLIVGGGGLHVYLGDAGGVLQPDMNPEWSFRTNDEEWHADLRFLGDLFGEGGRVGEMGAAVAVLPRVNDGPARIVLSDPIGAAYRLGQHLEVTIGEEGVEVTPLAFESKTAGSEIGSAVVVADLTGDGTADLVVAAPNGWAGPNSAVNVMGRDPERHGAVYVYLMDDGFPDAPSAVLDDFYGWGSPFGTAMTGASDFDDDGVLDLAVLNPLGGHMQWDPWPTLYCPNADPVWRDGAWTCETEPPGDWGEPHSLFDVPAECDYEADGDGWIQVFAGRPAAEWRRAGELGGGPRPRFLIRGPYLDVTPGSFNRYNINEFRRDEEPQTLVGGFDLNGDGHDDLALGVPEFGEGEGTGAGAVAFYFGRSSPDPRRTQVRCEADLKITGWDYFGLLGFAIAPFGDVDGDGCDEVALGLPGASEWNGRVHVLLGHGPQCARPDAQVVTLDADAITSAFGWSLIGDRDLDGDDVPDLLVSAPYAIDNRIRRGAIRPISGSIISTAIADGLTAPLEEGALPLDPPLASTPLEFLAPDVLWGDVIDDRVFGDAIFSAPGTPYAATTARFGGGLAWVDGIGDHGHGFAVGIARQDIGFSRNAGEVRVYAYRDVPVNGRHYESVSVMVGQTWRGNAGFGTNLASGILDDQNTVVIGSPWASPPEVQEEIDNGAVYLLRLE